MLSVHMYMCLFVFEREDEAEVMFVTSMGGTLPAPWGILHLIPSFQALHGSVQPHG